MWYIVKNEAMGHGMKYIIGRLKEASTWASISAALAALSSVPVFAPYSVPAAAICAAIGVFLREGKE